MHESTDALALAYLQHRGYVRGCLRRAGLSHETLDDAVHDVFAVLVRRRSDVDPRWSIRQYLAGIARNVAANHRRRARRPEAGSLAAWGEPPAGVVELRLDLVRELGELEPPQRDAVLQCDREGRSAAEIARAQGLPLTTVQWRLRTAHQRLRALLQRWRDAAAAFFAIDLRRLVGARVLEGGLAAALASAVVFAVTIDATTPPSTTGVPASPGEASAHGPARATAPPLAVALPPAASRDDALVGNVRLGTPRVDRARAAAEALVVALAATAVTHDPLAKPKRPRPRPTHRRPRALFPDDAIHYVMDDLHVPTRTRS